MLKIPFRKLVFCVTNIVFASLLIIKYPLYKASVYTASISTETNINIDITPKNDGSTGTFYYASHLSTPRYTRGKVRCILQ